MKTQNQNQKSGLKNRADQQMSTNREGVASGRTDNRLPIDSDQRKQNRKLPTSKVLNLLVTQLPDVYRLAEVVGKWVWVQFQDIPTAEIRKQLAQLGFHWNRERQAWQDPCGQFSLRSFTDPHTKYHSYFAADEKTI